ncbi:MAG TPA: gluconate 2-dehydrogenase subunit 3 family protein [Longimicrobiales bacterium]
MDARASVLGPHRATFRAFARTVVPEAVRLEESGWSEVEVTVEHALAQRPPRMRRQLGLLLRAIDGMARLRTGRAFWRLDDAARDRIVDALAHSRVLLVRRGIWGLRTLVLMGYYTRAETMRAVGYRAHARGWEARTVSP